MVAGRAFTHSITNSVFVPSLNFPDSISALVSGMPLPPQFMQDFLHESQHHACLTGVVGNTMALLYIRAVRGLCESGFSEVSSVEDAKHALELQRGNGDFKYSVLDDFIRFCTAEELLRPLNEGLALYSEFDSLPCTPNGNIGRTFITAYRLFGDCFGDPNGNRIPELISLVRNQRVGFDGCGRKASVLADRFPARDSPYLCGYTFAKQLVRKAQECHQQAADTERCASFLSNHFFNDFELSALLLSPENTSIDEHSRFLERLCQHLSSKVLTSSIRDSPSFNRLSTPISLPLESSHENLHTLYKGDGRLSLRSENPSPKEPYERALDELFRDHSLRHVSQEQVDGELGLLGWRQVLIIGRTTVQRNQRGGVSEILPAYRLKIRLSPMEDTPGTLKLLLSLNTCQFSDYGSLPVRSSL